MRAGSPPRRSRRAPAPPALTLVALAGLTACHTAAPRPGAVRAAYPRYGVQRVEVVALAISGPESGTDEDLQLRALPPPALHARSALEAAAPSSAELSTRYAAALCARLQGRGFAATAVPAESSVATQLGRARQRGNDAVLLVRYRWVDRLTLGRSIRVRVPARPARSDTRAPTSTELDVDAAEPQRALLLPSTAQLLDAQSGLELYRGPGAGAAAGDVLRAGNPYLGWGAIAAVDGGAALDPQAAIQHAATLAAGGLRPSPWRRSVDEGLAATLAEREPREARRALHPALVVGAGLLRFPVALDLGPATVELEPGTRRRLTLEQESLPAQLALVSGLELGYRDERLLALAQLRHAYLATSTARTYLRSDGEVRRAFPVHLGPLHDLSLTVLAGQQRLLRPWFGLRAAAGPSLHWHLIEGAAPAGTTLGGLNLALGAAATAEPFLAIGPLELGLRLHGGLAYDVAGGPLAEANVLVRAGASW